MRTTLADAKASRIPIIANLSPSDSRFADLINEAQQRLIQTGEIFWGSHQRVQFCVTSGCLVLPRQVASVETVAVCDQPIPIRNRWFEWLDSGIGIRSDSTCSTNENCGAGRCGGLGLLDRGEVCTFADIIPSDKKVKVYADVAEDSDAYITIQGYDDNNQWVRTLDGSDWIDGEKVLISTTPQTSATFFSAITGVQKPITNGPVRLYEYDTVNLTQRAIAVYEPDETNPSYRKMFISGLSSNGCCDCTGDDSGTNQVTVMAKLEFIPVRNDSDWLLIGNLPALKDEVQSIMKFENNLAEEGAFWHMKAIAGLRAEVRHYLGHGAVAPMKRESRRIGGAGVRAII